MLKWKIVATALCIGVGASTAGADALKITTGGSTGTYFRFGQEISQIAGSFGIDVEVAQSRGSVENLRRLLGYEGPSEGEFYQLGIVQADVLQELREKAEGNETLEGIVDKIKVVLPLYGEEIHVFVKKQSRFEDFDELLRNGFLLAGGKEGSGTLHTTNALVRIVSGGDNPIGIQAVGAENALESVLNGDVEGFVDVAGAPSKLGLSIEAKDELRLLPIDARRLASGLNSPYTAAEITSDTYPWLTENVRTAAVTSLLVAYDYGPENANCDKIQRLTQAIIANLQTLRFEGHSKWGDVNLRAARERTDLYECARRAIFDE